MHEILPRRLLPTAQAADGAPRLRWTLAEFEQLAELGFFTDEDHIELIGGELVPLAPKTVRHETMRGELGNCPAMRKLPGDVAIAAVLGCVSARTPIWSPTFCSTPRPTCQTFHFCRLRRCCWLSRSLS
jgi:hypothetical protein